MLYPLVLTLSLFFAVNRDQKTEVSSFKAKYETNGKYKMTSMVLFSPEHELVLMYAGADATEPGAIQYYNKKSNYFIHGMENGAGYDIIDSRKTGAWLNLKEYKLTERTMSIKDVSCSLLESENNKYGSVWVDLNTSLTTRSYYLNCGRHFPYGLVPTFGDTKFLTELQKDINVDAEVEQLKKKYFSGVPVVQ